MELAILCAHIHDAVTRADLLDRYHLVAFARVSASCASMVEQHLVEVLTPYLVGVRRTAANGAAECERVVAARIVGLEVGARLEHAHCAHLFEDTEPPEHGQVHG